MKEPIPQCWCGRKAYLIDPLFPYHCELNRCRKHRKMGATASGDMHDAKQWPNGETILKTGSASGHIENASKNSLPKS